MDETRDPSSASIRVRTRQPSSVFLFTGLAFLLMGVFLFVAGAWLIVSKGPEVYAIGVPTKSAAAPKGEMTERDFYNFYGRILAVYLGPAFLFVGASASAYVGMRLLNSAGAVAKQVLPSQDYELLAEAIRDGNEKAISEYIRLSSLSGTTGTFTKIGLTGLPLATIFLTVMLALLGVYEPKLLDLAQLTLGAFIGSYVQKRSIDATRGG